MLLMRKNFPDMLDYNTFLMWFNIMSRKTEIVKGIKLRWK